MSIESNAKIVSVVGGCHRSGRWIVPAKTQMKTLFGRAVIDLREAQTSAEELEFSCLSFFANITFIVPEGAEVRPSGLAILGSSKSTVPLTDVECKLPPMSVDATTIFGRLRIRTTETDSDHDAQKARFRQRKKHRPDEPAPPPPATPATPGVDMLDTPAKGVQADSTEAPAPAGAELAHVRAEQPPTPEGRRDLSAPIEPFPSEDSRSPIHEVVSPDDISEFGDRTEEPRTVQAQGGASEGRADHGLAETESPSS